MRILMIQPASNNGSSELTLAALTEPLALEQLAAVVPNHDVSILDMRLDSDLAGALEEFGPDVVAVTALTTEVYAARAVLDAVKKHSSEIFTVVGGHHATLIPADFFQTTVDAICLGEGEPVFVQLIEDLTAGRLPRDISNLVWQDRDGQFIDNGRTHIQQDMDKLPIPRRDLVEKYRSEYFFLFHKPDTTVATGRGCPYRCNFCSVWKFYEGRTCQMTARRVVEEIQVVETEHITFVDDNFMMSHQREFAIAEQLKSDGIAHTYSMQCRTDSIVRHPELVEKWVDIGLYAVLLGLEGNSDKILDKVAKKNTSKTNDEAIRILQANGVQIWGAFIVDPDWVADDFKALKDYVTEKQIPFTQYTVLTPLPGTQYFHEKQHELLTDDYACFDTLHAVVPTRLPREEFYQHFADLYAKPDLAAFYSLVRDGVLTIDNIREGNDILRAMSRWESYIETDPVLRANAKLAS